MRVVQVPRDHYITDFPCNHLIGKLLGQKNWFAELSSVPTSRRIWCLCLTFDLVVTWGNWLTLIAWGSAGAICLDRSNFVWATAAACQGHYSSDSRIEATAHRNETCGWYTLAYAIQPSCQLWCWCVFFTYLFIKLFYAEKRVDRPSVKPCLGDPSLKIEIEILWAKMVQWLQGDTLALRDGMKWQFESIYIFWSGILMHVSLRCKSHHWRRPCLLSLNV